MIFIRGGLSDAEIEEESGMSKQAAYKLAHGALNVVWEKLKTFDFPGVGSQASPSPLGFSGTKIKWVDQPQASNPFEIIHISRPGKGDGESLNGSQDAAYSVGNRSLVRLHGKEGTGK